MIGQYTIHRQGFKYYVVPGENFSGRLIYPDNFPSFYFERSARLFSSRVQRAWLDGYQEGYFTYASRNRIDTKDDRKEVSVIDKQSLCINIKFYGDACVFKVLNKEVEPTKISVVDNLTSARIVATASSLFNKVTTVSCDNKFEIYYDGREL